MTKKTYIFATILVSMGLLLASVGPVVATDELWAETYGGTDYDQFDGMVVMADGGFAMAGGYLEPGEEYLDMWLVRTDSTGAIIWEKKYTRPNHLAELAYSMIEVSTGGFLLAGQADGGRSWIVRTDLGGSMVWNVTFQAIGGNPTMSCFECSDGSFVFAGGNSLMKRDSNGNHLWNKTYETADAPEYAAISIFDVIETSGGDFVMTGYTDGLGAGEMDILLLKTNENGIELWNRTFGDVEYDQGHAVIEVSTGGYAAIGTLISPDVGTYAWLIRVDSDGDLLWNQTYVESTTTSSTQCEGRDVIECSDGGFAISGDIAGQLEGGSEILLVRTDSNGDYSWHRIYGGPGDDYGKVVAELPSGGFEVAGETRDEMATTSDGILVVFEDSAPVDPAPDMIPLLIGVAVVVVLVIVLVLVMKRR